MKTLHVLFVGLFVLIVTPVVLHAQKKSPESVDTENFGIVEGLWFSEEPFFHGETITAYTTVQNNSGNTAWGLIIFTQDDEKFAKVDYKVAHKDIVEYSAQTDIAYGQHMFTITIEPESQGDEIDPLGGPRREAKGLNSTYSREIFVDYDTDGDRIGNQIDEDDDGDGYNDEEEIQAETDPLDKNDYPKPPEPEIEPDYEAVPESSNSSQKGSRKRIPDVFKKRTFRNQ